MSVGNGHARTGWSADFQDRVIIVTGAGQGLGRAVATAFARWGANVVVADVEEGSAVTVVQEIEAAGGSARAMVCDVSVSQQTAEMVDATLARFGRIDVLVNNAGVTSAAAIVDLSDDEWDRVFAVNAKGTFLCCRAVLPTMLAQREGAVVNVSSQAGLSANRFLAHYCAAKAAVISFTRVLALEAAPWVRANCVCPGTVDTPMLRASFQREAALHGMTVEDFEDERLRDIPLGRYQDVQAIAEGVLFLASSAAAEITGEALSMSGGMVMS